MIILVFNLIYNVFLILILARVITSWIRVSPYHPTWGPIVKFIHDATEPLLAPIRNILPSMGGLDFSPIILLLGLRILRDILFGVFL